MPAMVEHIERQTKQKDAIRNQLAGCEEFLSAQDLHRSLQDSGIRIGLATVYRQLNSLAESGAVDTIHIIARQGQLDALERQITQAVIAEHHVILTGIGVYSTNTTDDCAGQILRDVRRIAMSKEFILQMHGFSVDAEKKLIRFDVIVDYAAPDAAAIHAAIVDEVKALYPEYDVQVVLDVDVSD